MLVLNKSNIFLICVLLWLPFTSKAQSRCGFEVVHKKVLDRSSIYQNRISELEKIISSNKNLPIARSGIQGNLKTQAALYTIPVVIHVIHAGGAVGDIDNPSDAQLLGAISYLNSVFNGTMPGIQGVGDIEIQFELARQDPNCNPTNAINRVNGSSLANYAANGVNVSGTSGADELAVKNLIRWDPSKYYNIWVINKFDGQDGTSGSFVGGFAYFPGAPPQLDGTMILATQMATNRKTLPHELGHAFAVYHPFEGYSGTTCAADSSCSTQGDRVCDTDPITLSFSCRTGTNDCTGTPYNINTENNFMSYTNCATLFTAGQKARMLSAATSPFRNYSGSWALSSTYPLPSFSAPMPAGCTPVYTGTSLTSSYAGVMNLTLNGISVRSSTSYIDGGYRNNTNSCHHLIYLQEGQTYNLSVRLFGLNAEQAKVWIDFNNDGVFNNAEELIGSMMENAHPTTTRPPAGLTVDFPVVIPPTAVKDQVLRLRVLNELSTIYGQSQLITDACVNPYFGQAEDYPVFIRSLSLLPVELLNFNATVNGNDVQLKWQTAGEQNAAGFDIERSADGELFTKIDHQDAMGRPSNYEKVDQGLQPGTYYYRLKQIDKDNRFVYSKTLKVSVGSRTSYYRILNNPADTYVDLSLPFKSTATSINLIDVSGRLLTQRTIAAGSTRYRLEGIDKYSPGVYFIQIIAEGERSVLKFVKR